MKRGIHRPVAGSAKSLQRSVRSVEHAGFCGQMQTKGTPFIVRLHDLQVEQSEGFEDEAKYWRSVN